MPRKRDSPEQMITKLRQAEVELSRGLRLQEAGCQRADVLPVAQRVRRPPPGPSQATEDPRAREGPAEAAGGRSGAR